MSKQFRELSFDDRIWKRLYVRFFVEGEAEESIPFFWRNHFKRHTKNMLQNTRMQYELSEASLETQEADYESEDVSANAFLAAIRKKKKQLPKGGVASRNFFAKFRREISVLRMRCPIVVMDMGPRKIFFGKNTGYSNGNWKDSFGNSKIVVLFFAMFVLTKIESL